MSRLFQPRYEHRDHPRGWQVVRVGMLGFVQKFGIYRDEDAARAVAHVLGEYAYLEK